LAKHRTPILGGDVWRQLGSHFESTYDNWYEDPKPGEANDAYARRSAEVSQRYVENYKEPPNAVTLYQLVLPEWACEKP